MGNIFFTADTHFGHKNIIKYCGRPFGNVHKMDDEIIKRWNEVVGEKDTVFHLGDFGWFKKTAVECRGQLKGRIVLFRGTHDKNIPKSLFAETHLAKRFKINGIKIMMCHFPFQSWPHSHHGSWHLHGHSHGNAKPIPNACRLDVGVDTHNFYPWSFAEIEEYMKDKYSKFGVPRAQEAEVVAKPTFRKGQTLGNFLLFLRHKELAGVAEGVDYADPFYIPDEEWDNLWTEFIGEE